MAKYYAMNELSPDNELFHEGKPVVVKDERNSEGTFKRSADQQVMAAWGLLSSANFKIQDRIRGRRFEMRSELDFMEMVMADIDRVKVALGHVGRYIDAFDEPPNDGRYYLVEPGREKAIEPDKPRFIIKRRVRCG